VILSIFVAGHNGMVEPAIVRELKAKGYENSDNKISYEDSYGRKEFYK
jgi:hypothetical protein